MACHKLLTAKAGILFYSLILFLCRQARTDNMKVQHHSFDLPFVYPFTISKGTKTVQPIFIAELDFNGIKGYGEAPAISYYNFPVEKMAADLEAKKTLVEKYALIDAERYWHYLHHLFPQNPFLVCALDIAAWDITV